MLKSFFISTVLENTVGHVLDNHIRDTVDEPMVGSILYCDLAASFAEHSGVYLGNGEIMQLNRKGWIEIVTAEEFTEGTPALSIYISCGGSHPVGNSAIAERARRYEREISVRDYNVLLDNCHQFSAGCVLDDPENSNNFLWMLKDVCKKHLGADCWRVWRNPGQRAVELSGPERLQQVQAAFKEALQRQSDLVREMSALTDERWQHNRSMPTTVLFYESRMAAWEARGQELDLREKNLNSTLDDLEKQRFALEQEKLKLEQHYS